MNLSLTVIVRFLIFILIFWVVFVKTLDKFGKVDSGLKMTKDNPWQYEDDRHEPASFRECVRYRHYFPLGLLVGIIKQNWYVDKAVLFPRFTVSIYKVVKLHSRFNIVYIFWARVYSTVIQSHHVLTKIEKILLRSIEFSFCYIIFHVFFDRLFKVFIIEVAV